MKTKFDSLESIVEGNYRVVNTNGDQVISTPTTGECRTCGDFTTWVSVSFCTYYCSAECLEKEWEGYFNEARSALDSN